MSNLQYVMNGNVRDAVAISITRFLAIPGSTDSVIKSIPEHLETSTFMSPERGTSKYDIAWNYLWFEITHKEKPNAS